MKVKLSLVVLLLLVPALASNAFAEDRAEKPDAAQTADNLRLQLIDVQAKEEELQARARQLEENSKPENIERSLAGVGSTKPEELRELRRKQLSIELGGVRSQLKLLASSRERLESSIRNAEALAYQQSAEGPTLPVAQAFRMQSGKTTGWLIIAGGVVALLGIAFTVAVVRRRGNRRTEYKL